MENAKKEKNFWVPNNNWRPIVLSGLLTLLLASPAFYYSWEANRIAKEANRISNDIQEKEDYNFTLQNRPILDIEPVEFTDSGFIKIKENNGTINTEIQIKITNYGNLTAHDLTLPSDMQIKINFEEPIKKDLPVYVTIPKNAQDLAPGKSFYLILSAKEVIYDIQKRKERVTELRTNPDVYIATSIPII